MDTGWSDDNRDVHRHAANQGQAGQAAGDLEDLSQRPATIDPRPATANPAGQRPATDQAAQVPPAGSAAASRKPPRHTEVVRGIPMEQRITLAAALSLGALGAGLPAVLLVWLVFALLARGVAAEVLEHTGGLAATTFGGGYWLALIVNVLVVLGCLVKLAYRRPNPWRPLVVLIMAYAMLSWIFIPFDWLGIFDAPDVFTTFAVLGATQLITYVLPFALIILTFRGILHAWRVGSKSATASGRIAALAACLGVAGSSVSLALVAAQADGYFDDLTPGGDEANALAPQGVEGDRQMLADLSADIGPPASRLPGIPAYDAFGSCAERLTQANDRGRRLVELAMMRLGCMGLPMPKAQRAARNSLFWVCANQADDSPDGIEERYRWTVIASLKAYREQHGNDVRMRCESDEWEFPDAYVDRESTQQLAFRRDMATMNKAFRGLDANDQLILDKRYIDGLEPAGISKELGKGQRIVRKELRRARNRLWNRFHNMRR